VSKPYFLRFYVRGIGFKVWPLLNYYGIRGRLGFNHKSLYIFSRGLLGRGRKYKFVLSSISLSQLRQAAVDVVKLRNPDVYRVKGVRFLGDNLFPKPRKDKRK
jgi:ribosomal protein L6P/L9E